MHPASMKLERNVEWWVRWFDGETFTSIAKTEGVSPERVGAICHRINTRMRADRLPPEGDRWYVDAGLVRVRRLEGRD